MRNHIPYGYVFAKEGDAPEIPADCEVLIVANQEWLSDAQIAAIWEEKAAAYDAERMAQEARLAAGLPVKEE